MGEGVAGRQLIGDLLGLRIDHQLVQWAVVGMAGHLADEAHNVIPARVVAPALLDVLTLDKDA